jgi:DNA-binding CsgD family transcriptional regulator
MGCLLAGTVFLRLLIGESKFIVESGKHNINTNSMRQAQQVLFLFVFVITINSGFMYQVVNPQFGHLSGIMTWYWAVPYIVAIGIMGRLAPNIKGAPYIYIALIMLMSALVGFIFLEHNLIGYLIINALMLGSFGVFDLFWWSILGEMLEYSKNPARVFGVGLSANVLGILVGGIFGYFGNQYEFSTTEITVIALVVLCITILLLPLLNQKIKALLKSHTYLAVYGEMAELEQREMVQSVMEMLTNREKEVLEQILYGKTNSAIGEKLSISENTVKTHVGNIYSKYDVRSRAELINTVLRNTVNIKT